MSEPATQAVKAVAEANDVPQTAEQILESFDFSDPNSYQDVLTRIYELLAENGLKILAAVAILFIGLWVAKVIANCIKRHLDKAKVEATLVSFVHRLCHTVLIVFVVIAALGAAGIKTASFVAVLGAAGLAVGLALQGSLSNFAAGVLLIIFKPFKVGDFVTIAGKTGTVQEIQIFTTILNSPDNLRIIVPNAAVTGESIVNFTVNGNRRVDLVIGISYEDDIKKATEVIEQVVKADDRVLDTPEPTVAVSELADSSVNLVVRPWCKPADYWDVYFGITEKVKLALDANDITIPFPQRDVNMKTSD